MSVKAKMDKLKRVLSGQDDDDEQTIVTQASLKPCPLVTVEI